MSDVFLLIGYEVHNDRYPSSKEKIGEGFSSFQPRQKETEPSGAEFRLIQQVSIELKSTTTIAQKSLIRVE